jgi:hypothetical protein
LTVLPRLNVVADQCEPEEQSRREAPYPSEARVDGDEASATIAAG